MYEMPRSLLRHLISTAWILFCNCAVSVQDSHAYRKMEIISACSSLTLTLREMLWCFHIVLSFIIAVVVCAALVRISAFKLSSLIMAPMYLNESTGSSSFLLTVILVVIGWALLPRIGHDFCLLNTDLHCVS